MIQSISSKLSDGKTLVLNLRSSNEEEGLLIIDIEGLGPGEAVINLVTPPNVNGGIFNSKRLNKRTITIRIANTNYGDLGEETRNKLYKFFPLGEEITLGVELLKRKVYIKCFVEEIEGIIFNRIENFNITLVCPTPFFSAGEERIVLSSVVNAFYFPWSNNSLNENLLVFSEYLSEPYVVIDYLGKKTGLVFEIDILGSVGDITILNTRNTSMTINSELINNSVGGLQSGDKLILDTRTGLKSLVLLRSGVRTSFLSALGPFTGWITLDPGLNRISVESPAGVDNFQTTVVYETLLIGV